MTEPWTPVDHWLSGTGKLNSKLHLRREYEDTEALCGVGVVGASGPESTYSPHLLCAVCRRMYVQVTGDEPPVVSLLH